MKKKLQLIPILLFSLFLFNQETEACTSFNLNYTFTSANQGQTVTVTWTSTGCTPGTLVDISLIDVAANAIVQYYPNTANSGSFSVTLGAGLTPGVYRFYIQNAPWPPDAWGYGPDFDIVIPTPVELTVFTGKLIDEKSIELNWETASELDNKGFEIEYSTNGIDWMTIDFVEGAGETELTQAYQFVHNAPEGRTNYYRLKQLDFSGMFEYSPIVSVQMQDRGADDVAVYPNPFTDYLLLSDAGEEVFNFQLINTLGEVVLHGVTNANQIDVSGMASGVYRLVLFSNDTMVSYQSIIKR